jgi:glycosyltransferase involved in cell wall biosynthesis
MNLFSALRDQPSCPVEPVLFVDARSSSALLDGFAPILNQPPLRSDLWSKGSRAFRTRMLSSVLLQKDYLVERAFGREGIDLVFQNSAWYGWRFSLPTLAWFADFQHRHLPGMFSTADYWRREISFQAMVRSATRVLVSSRDAQHDCETFYPASRGKIAALPFAVRIAPETVRQDPDATRAKYGLPERFLFFPGQFWKHKNHLGLIEALHVLAGRGERVTVVASGNTQDYRDPGHPERIAALLKRYRLGEYFRVLGMIPYQDVFPLMRASVAVINPSFFEGWSTTVEEAKALGVPLLLSDLRVHREQAPAQCLYFDPYDPAHMAEVIGAAWSEWFPGPHLELEKAAAAGLSLSRSAFAQGFVTIAQQTAARYVEAGTYRREH